MNITIPDDLHERLQSVKDSVGNVSAVCQSAIERVVSLEEAKMNAVSDRENMIVRLRDDREQTTDIFFMQGKKSGLESVPVLSYSDLKSLEALYAQKSDVWVFDATWLVTSLEENENLSWLFDEVKEEGCPADLVPNYMEGWIEGVMEIWDDIKEEVE